MNDDDPIANKLGLTPMSSFDTRGDIVEHKTTTIEKSTPEKELDTDRDYARTNFYDAIEAGSRALQEMLDVAQQSNHPRAYEVVATLIKTLTDANKDLVAMSEKRVPEKSEADQPKTVTNNNLIFQGSTKELLKMIKDNDD